jgi:hypothetical protein
MYINEVCISSSNKYAATCAVCLCSSFNTAYCLACKLNIFKGLYHFHAFCCFKFHNNYILWYQSSGNNELKSEHTTQCSVHTINEGYIYTHIWQDEIVLTFFKLIHTMLININVHKQKINKHEYIWCSEKSKLNKQSNELNTPAQVKIEISHFLNCN